MDSTLRLEPFRGMPLDLAVIEREDFASASAAAYGRRPGIHGNVGGVVNSPARQFRQYRDLVTRCLPAIALSGAVRQHRAGVHRPGPAPRAR